MNLAQVFVLHFSHKNVAQQPRDPLKSRLNGPLLQLPMGDTQTLDPLVHLGPASAFQAYWKWANPHICDTRQNLLPCPLSHALQKMSYDNVLLPDFPPPFCVCWHGPAKSRPPSPHRGHLNIGFNRSVFRFISSTSSVSTRPSTSQWKGAARLIAANVRLSTFSDLLRMMSSIEIRSRHRQVSRLVSRGDMLSLL